MKTPITSKGCLSRIFLHFLPVLMLLLGSTQAAMAQAPTSLMYPVTSSYTSNVDNVYLSPTVSGVVTSYAISPGLPAGLSFNTGTGVITGVPTSTSGPTVYTVTATNASGSTTATFTLQTLNAYYNNANNQVSFLGANATVKVNNGAAGTGGQNAGDIVLYQNVVTIGTIQIDCIIKTVAVTNVTAWNAYDQSLTTDGSTFSSNEDSFFSPQVNFGTGGGSIRFDFQYILGGTYNNITNTGTNVTLQNVRLNTYDIDGNGTANSNQYNEFGGFTTSELATPTTNETATYDATTGLTKYRSNVAVNTLAVTNPLNRIRVNYANISDFTILVGAEAGNLAYFFLDFSVGSVAFTTTTTNAPAIDLNATLPGNVNGTSGCGTGLAFSASGTNLSDPSDAEVDFTVEFATAQIVNGANEGLFISGPNVTIPLNFVNGASVANVTVGGVTYAVAASVVSGVSKLTFTKNGGGTFTTAQAESLLDALQYQNAAAAPTAGDRDFTVNFRNATYKSPDAVFTATLNCVTISGNIWHDANALTNNTVDANSTIGQFAAGSMYAVLVNQGGVNNNKVAVAPVAIAAGGAYSFGTATPGSYYIYFVPSGSVPAVNSTFTASIYPTNAGISYISTGENLGAGAGNDLLVDGKLSITVGSVSATNANFGLELAPATTSSVLNSIPNPGGFNNYIVPVANPGFIFSDVDGTVDTLIITAFPTGANYISIGNTIYTNGGTCPPQSTCMAWPGSVAIHVTGGIPDNIVSVDPASDGNTQVIVPYKVFDNGHVVSNNSTVTINFTVPVSPLVVSGNVWDDVNGNGIKEGTENYTNVADAGETLYAVLIQNTNTYSGAPTILTSTTVTAAATGYSFSNVPSGNNYEVRIVSLAPGSAPVAGAAASTISPDLADGYTGISYNNNGAITTGLNTSNPIIALGVVTTDKPNVNFGIEALPTPVDGADAARLNPGGTISSSVAGATFSGTDLLDDPDGFVTYVHITALPGNTTSITITGSLTVGGAVTTTTYGTGFGAFPSGGVYIASSANGNIPNGAISLDPVDGAVTAGIPFRVIDNAGIESIGATGTVNVPFSLASISGTIFDDANGITNSLIDGFVTNAGGTLYASLVQANTVVTTTAIPAGGTFNFTGLYPGSYSVIISTNNYPGGTVNPLGSLPANYVNTSEAISPAFQDGVNTNDGITAVTISTVSVSGVNFGIEQKPAANAASQTYINPGGTTTVVVPTLNGTDPEQGTYPGTGNLDTIIINTLPATGTLYYNGTPVTASQQINNYDPALLTYDPIDGTPSVTFTYSETDAALQSSAPATVTLTFTDITISGTVHNDANGGTISGPGIGSPASTTPIQQLYANLINNSGNITGSVPVNADGTYTLGTANGVMTNTSGYAVVLSPTQGTNGNPAATLTAITTIPGEWINTAEGTTAAGDGTPDGATNTFATTTANVANVDFAIEQKPTAGAGTQTALNPGGTINITVNAAAFTNGTSSSDPAPGAVTAIIITGMPTGAATITINGITYGPGFMAFPGGGVTIPADGSGNPTQTITVDPSPTGAGTVDIPFKTVDAAGAVSTNTGHAVITLTGLSIAGTVYNDHTGTTNNAIDGIATNVIGANTMFANLVDPVSGNVLASVPVAANGTYTFTNASGVYPNTTYNVVVTNAAGTVGAPPPATALINGVNTSEAVTTGTGNPFQDGTNNGITSVIVGTANVTGVDFGIDLLPAPATLTAASQVNPGGTTSVTVPQATFAGTDPDGVVDSIRITAFPPANATSITVGTATYYAAAAGIPAICPTATCAVFPGAGITVPAPGGVPTTAISVDPANGAVSVSIPYVTIDDAGKESATTGTANVPFTDVVLSGTVYNDANGVTDMAINGTATSVIGTNTLYASLIQVATGLVVGSVPVNTNGTYSFTTATGVTINTDFAIAVTNTAGTTGQIPPSALLTGAVNTSEAVTTAAGSPYQDIADNGYTAVRMNTASVSGIDFGIDRTTTADNKAYNVSPLAFSLVQPTGFPVQIGYITILASSTDLPGTSLSGNDPEDCQAASSCNNGATFMVTAVNANTLLYYNYGGTTGIQPVAANTTIPDYDPANLVIYALLGSGGAGNAIGFDYQLMDAANKGGTPAQYRINTSTPLPVKLISFEAAALDCTARLSWKTATEISTTGFEVEHSTDGRTYTAEGRVQSTGNINGAAYTFDAQLATGANYYRLRMTDADGSYSYSSIAMLNGSCHNTVSMYPNPVNEVLQVAGLPTGALVVVYSATGQAVASVHATGSTIAIGTGAWAQGVYLVKVMSGGAVLQSTTIIKNQAGL